MSADWPVVRLGDYCEKIGSGATPRGGSGVYLEVGEICLIRSQNVYNDGFKEDGLVYITEDSAEKLKNVVVEENDVLLNITGDSVARVCLARKEYLPARVNQHVAIIRPDEAEFDPRYLRYLLASPAMQDLLLTIAGAGATRNALTKGMIESLEVMKPPLIVQVAIADNLESLDNKIELNRQTNQTLEQIAQSIFKSWFVDFDPVRAKIAARQAFIQQHPEVTTEAIRAAVGTEADTLAHAGAKACEIAAMCAVSGKTEEQLNELDADTLELLKATVALFPDVLEESELGEVPEGWAVIDLSCVTTEIRRGISPKYSEDGGVKVVNQKCIRDHSINFELTRFHDPIQRKVDGRYAEIGDVLVNSTGVGTLGRLAPVRYIPEPFVFDSHVTVVRADASIISKSYLIGLMFLNEKLIEESGAGSTGQTELRKQVLEEIVFAKPPIELGDVYENLAGGINNQIAELEKQQLVLAELRDALLPKLLSGELQMDEVA